MKKLFVSNRFIFIVGILLAVSPFLLSDFRTNLVAKFMTYAIVALALDLMWGYTGILSLGQGVFFGLGAYCMAMYLKLEASGERLPDFMVWSGTKELPLFWQPFQNPVFAILMVVLIPALFATVLGYLTFKNRIKGVFFSIFTQAVSIIFVVLFVGKQELTGGTNGITNFKTILGFSLKDGRTQMFLFYITLIILIGIYILLKAIVNGKMGRILIGIRDGENRLRFMGYNPTKYKVFVYALGAAISGIAGALFVIHVGIISPSNMAIVPSIEMIIWVAIGGRGTLQGAVLGALLVNAVKTGVSEQFPDIWSFFVGIMFVVFVVFLPYGLMGIIKGKMKKVFYVVSKNKLTGMSSKV